MAQHWGHARHMSNGARALSQPQTLPSRKRYAGLEMSNKGVKILAARPKLPLSPTVKNIMPTWPYKDTLTIPATQSNSKGRKDTGMMVRSCHAQCEHAFHFFFFFSAYTEVPIPTIWIPGGRATGKELDCDCGALVKGTNACIKGVLVNSLAPPSTPGGWGSEAPQTLKPEPGACASGLQNSEECDSIVSKLPSP